MSGIRLTVIRRGDSLVPAAQMFVDDIRKIPEGQSGVVTWHRVRSLPHHRRFFAKLRKLCQAGAWDSTEDSLLNLIKVGIGHVVTVIDNSSSMVSGSLLMIAEKIAKAHPATSDEGKLARFVISIAGPKSFLVPKSVAFEKLDEDGFKEFEKLSDEFCARQFGIAPEDLMREASDLAAPVYPDTVPEAPQIDEDATEAPAAANDTGEPSDALAGRLRALAKQLGTGTPNEVLHAWHAAWQLDDTKELVQTHRAAVEAIVKFAKMKAAGDIRGDADKGYIEMTEKVIAKATERRAA